MSETREGFRPGPWEWVGRDWLEAPSGVVMDASGVDCGSYCQGGKPVIDISDADRALIAAAPDLYTALVEARADIDGYNRTEYGCECVPGSKNACSTRKLLDRIDRALAAARGETSDG